VGSSAFHGCLPLSRRALSMHVSSRVSKRVIDIFEVVEIDKEQGCPLEANVGKIAPRPNSGLCGAARLLFAIYSRVYIFEDYG
jgi:hypothetical protein